MPNIAIAPRVANVIGTITIALVALIPIIGMVSDTSVFLEPAGLKVLSSPIFVQALIFGTTCAAIGNMTASLVLSFALMHLFRHTFTSDDGTLAKKFFKQGIVRNVQENLFSHTQPTTL